MAVEWDFAEYLGINALEYFLAPCRCAQCSGRVWGLRDWPQFMRFYQTLSQITGSYIQAVQMSDPEVIEALCEMPVDSDWRKVTPPRWWRFTDEMHRLTDIADQLIASRATSGDVKFYPRPVNVAAKERARRRQQMQDDRIEQARLEDMKRRGLTT